MEVNTGEGSDELWATYFYSWVLKEGCWLFFLASHYESDAVAIQLRGEITRIQRLLSEKS